MVDPVMSCVAKTDAIARSSKEQTSDAVATLDDFADIVQLTSPWTAAAYGTHTPSTASCSHGVIDIPLHSDRLGQCFVEHAPADVANPDEDVDSPSLAH